jgi:hypothetical protein
MLYFFQFYFNYRPCSQYHWTFPFTIQNCYVYPHTIVMLSPRSGRVFCFEALNDMGAIVFKAIRRPKAPDPLFTF